MIRDIHIENFKSIESLDISLGKINVLIGANGSGKTNILEAIGVLSAATSGRVDDMSLIRRGVRPGDPSIYKSAFKDQKIKLHIVLEAKNDENQYLVSLFNPIEKPKKTWNYHTENWQSGSKKIASRSNRSKESNNPEAGLAALKMVELSIDDPAIKFLKTLQNYVIYSPDTQTLRGLIPDSRQIDPLGLSGGQLASSFQNFQRSFRDDLPNDNEKRHEIFDSIYELIDWANGIGILIASQAPVSSSVPTVKKVLQFRDKYMLEKRNILSAADVSEGALYIIFLLLVSLYDKVPNFIAIDNVDQALNPRLAKKVIEKMCEWIKFNNDKQIIMTTHNPLVLDGLNLKDDEIRLFTVDRTISGKTAINRLIPNEKLLKQLEKDNYSLSKLWVMGHIGGVPNV